MLLRVVGPVVAQSLKPVKLFAPCKETQHCEMLCPFARAHSPKCQLSCYKGGYVQENSVC